MINARPVSGFPVTMDRDYDGNEMFTKYFSYKEGVKKDGYRLKSLRWLQSRRVLES